MLQAVLFTVVFACVAALDWSSCAQYQCTTITHRLFNNIPSSQPLTLFLRRYAADTTKRKGSIFILGGLIVSINTATC
jgi:hypothetical protein